METVNNGPQFLRFVIPILAVLKKMGGSGKPQVVTDKVIAYLEIPEADQLETLKTGGSRIRNQIAWARFYLVRGKLLDASERGQWMLTPAGMQAQLSEADVVALFQNVQAEIRAADNEWSLEQEIQQAEYEVSDADFWESMSQVNYWWFNQDSGYQKGQKGGYIWMPSTSFATESVTHPMTQLISGDLLFHQVGDHLVATSVIIEPAQWQAEADGWRAIAHYYPLAEPLLLTQLQAILPFNLSQSPTQLNLLPADLSFAPTQLALLTQNLLAEPIPLLPYLHPLSRTIGEQVLNHLQPAYLRDRSRVWLFQVDMNTYPLSQQLKQHKVGDIATLPLQQNYQDLQPSDLLILWQVDNPAGIHAIGGVISEVFAQENAWALHYRYIHILQPPLTSDDCVKNPLLQQLAIFQQPDIERCRITVNQWYALKTLIYPRQQTTQVSRTRKVNLPDIHTQLQQHGLLISQSLLRRYHLALQRRGLVILCGVSGVGKTWLAEQYARAIDARYLLVPVAANWMSQEDLLGYYNPLTEQYQETAASYFLREAATHYEQQGQHATPYHLILDEMNLARIEFYFAHFLSVMEQRARGQIAYLQFGREWVPLTPNVIVIGTVNMDETTQAFADKVYDRAQLLELTVNADDLRAQLDGLPYQACLITLWQALWPVAPFAFRTVAEIKQYVTAAAALSVPWQTALDEQLVQKILPRVRGTDSRLAPALETVLDVAQQHELPLTLEKATMMYEQWRSYGLTSFF